MIPALGPWQWRSDVGPQPCWAAPDGAVSCVDLRAIPDQSLLGTYDQFPHSLFLFQNAEALAKAGIDYYAFGEGRIDDLKLAGVDRSTWESMLGIAPVGDTVADAMIDLLTNSSSPDGATPSKVLLPGHAGFCEIHIPWHSVIRRWKFGAWNPDGNSHHNRVRDLLRAGIGETIVRQRDKEKRLRRAAVDARKGGKRDDADKLDALADRLKGDKKSRQVLGGLVAKYRCEPSDITQEVAPLKPETVVSDDFNRANGNLGANWGNYGFVWAVAANGIAKYTGSGATGWATNQNPLSTDDHYAQIKMVIGNAYYAMGPMTRNPNNGTFTYYSLDNYADQMRLIKVVAGAGAVIASAAWTYAVGETYRQQSDGSSLTGYVDGSEKVSVTDTALSGQLHTGCTAYTGVANDSAQMDDFYATDLIPPVDPPIITTELDQALTVGQAFTLTLEATSSEAVTWTVEEAELPDGVTFDNDDTISGTPSEAGVFTVEITATNSGGSDTEDLVLTVAAAASGHTNRTLLGVG